MRGRGGGSSVYSEDSLLVWIGFGYLGMKNEGSWWEVVRCIRLEAPGAGIEKILIVRFCDECCWVVGRLSGSGVYGE